VRTLRRLLMASSRCSPWSRTRASGELQHAACCCARSMCSAADKSCTGSWCATAWRGA
jgi:hypothetical protein